MELIIYRNGLPFTVLYDECDHELICAHKWHFRDKNGYVSTRIKGKNFLLHRLLIVLTEKNLYIDHINGDRFDNRRSNLRVCSRLENAKNRRVSKNSKCGFRGVNAKTDRDYFVAQIRVDKRYIYLGASYSMEDCARMYNYAARELHGKFAKYNNVFPLFPEKYTLENILPITNKSGYRGVHWCKTSNKWVVVISVNGKGKTIGRFKEMGDAIAKHKEVIKSISVFSKDAR